MATHLFLFLFRKPLPPSSPTSLYDSLVLVVAEIGGGSTGRPTNELYDSLAVVESKVSHQRVIEIR